MRSLLLSNSCPKRTAAHILGGKDTQSIPIIFVTAISKEDKYVFRGYQVGAVDYLFKPLDPVILQSKVNFFLQLDRQKRRLEAKLAKARASERAMNEAWFGKQ